MQEDRNHDVHDSHTDALVLAQIAFSPTELAVFHIGVLVSAHNTFFSN